MSGINAYVIDTSSPNCAESGFTGAPLSRHSALLIVAVIVLMAVMYYCATTGMRMPASRGYGAWLGGGRRLYYR